ncbi:MAG: pseudouridine synthase [Pseudomonadales bacterium]
MDESTAGERLQKVLAGLGLGSRREIETWIGTERIRVNGELAHLGQRVSDDDVVEVDGRRVNIQRTSTTEVLVLNKAGGTVCTRSDPEGRKTIYADLPQLRHGRWISVGRLDIQTSGLLLLTNDGQLANRLTHPSTGLDREYAVRINRKLEDEELTQLKAGVESEGETLRFSDIRYYNGSDNNVWYHVVLMEGKNREVRRLFEAIGCVVSRLKRVRYGPVILPSWLRNGQWASMTRSDVRQIHRMLDLPYQVPKKSITKASKVAKTSCLLPYPKLGN